MPASIVLFTRWPRPGRAKTRLIPALGPEGAADLQRRLTRLAVARAWSHCATTGDRLVVAHEGGSLREMTAWLGRAPAYLPQPEGSLGLRLHAVTHREFETGASKVVVAGTDCPRLSPAHLAEAVRRLDDADLVFGPARDGGYYLVGLRHQIPGLWENIPWSSPDTLAASLRLARGVGASTSLLDPLPDVDEPEDLPDAHAALLEAARISVIIPTWNEADNLRQLLPRLLAGSPHQILVADAASSDDTAAVATARGATVLPTPRGRATQMNAAAAAATGEYLLFLHADTDPPPDWPVLIPSLLDQPGVAAGAFRFALREPVPLQGTIEALTRLRGRLRSLPYGDQGLFLRRHLFHALGGYPDWPILEDVEFIRRLRRTGTIRITREPAPTSSRRWSTQGVCRTFLVHQAILAGHLARVPPERLAALRRRLL